MLHGVFTLWGRSLRLEAKWLRMHLFRVVFVFAIYFLIITAQMQSLFVGAPGLDFLHSMLQLNVAFIMFGGIGFFATAITEEKEEETIGLLMMAGISPVSLLLGKSTSRLLEGLFLIAAQFPFTLLAITLGGVTMSQVLAAYVALFAFTILFANVGLFASVVCRRSGTAMAMMTIFLVLAAIVPPCMPGLRTIWIDLGWPGLTWINPVFHVIEHSSIWTRLVTICATGFDEPIFGTQVVTHLVGALVAFGLAWWAFPRFALDSDANSVSRGLLTQAGRSGVRRWLSTRRAWAHPLMWKEYYFLSGGDTFMVVKLVIGGLLYPALYGLMLLADGNYSGPSWDDLFAVHMGCVIGVIVIELAVNASRLFHDEIRGQTMVSLLMLPRSIGYVAYSKLIGSLIGLTPLLLWLVIDLSLLTNGWANTSQVVAHPFFWFGVLMLTVFLHITVLLSLFLKWGALPIAFFVTLLTMYCCPVFMFPMMILMAAREPGDEAPMLWLASLVTITITALVSFVFQMMIHARLYELGSK